MANTPIKLSELPLTSSAVANAIIPIVSNGSTYKIEVSAFANSLTLSSASYALTASYILGGISETSSYATTASYWSGSITSASHADFADTASYVNQAVSASYWSGSITSASHADFADTASYVRNAVTASYVIAAATASYVERAQTASYVIAAATASYISVAETASYFNAGNLVGTASQAFTASYALTASYISGAITANQFPYSGTAIITGSLEILNTGEPSFFLIKSSSFDALKVTSSGVLVFGAFENTPTVAAGGMFYSASGEFFLGM